MQTIYLIRTKTDECQDWIDEHVNVPDYMYYGNAFAVETRYVGPIVEALQDAGFQLDIDFNIQGEGRYSE